MLNNQVLKRISAAALAAMLIFSAACNTAKNPTATPAPSAEPTAALTEEPSAKPTFSPVIQGELPKAPFANPVSDLSFDEFDAEERSRGFNPELGFEIRYQDDKIAVLYCMDGVFIYDFEKQSVTIGVDFLKVFGVHGLIQGDPGKWAGASVSSDGEIIMLARYVDNENNGEYVIDDSYYIHVPSMTYIWGNYGELESRTDFEPIDSLENGMEFYNELVIEHNGKEYKIFEDTSFVNGK